MARLPDPPHSRAVLLGCSDYNVLERIPSVRNNISDLAQTLAESEGFRSENVHMLLNPRYGGVVESRLQEIAQQTSDILFMYFSGHGLINSAGKLHLALPDTSQSQSEATSLPFETLQAVLSESPARIRVVILDCVCPDAYAASPRGISPMLDVRSAAAGQFTLMSTAARRAASPSAEPYTAFTGELIRLLQFGFPGPSEFLTLGTIAAQLRLALVSSGHPPPQVMDTNGVGRILGLIRNPAYTDTTYTSAAYTGATHAPHASDSAPEAGPPPASDGPDGSGPSSHVSGRLTADLDTEDVEWAHDAPATVDMLDRLPAARVLGLRLTETQVTQPDTSFLVHLDGPWGSGKSSLLNLLEQQIEDTFLVARFDAWQQSRLAPAWWSLLTCLRRRVAQRRPWWRRSLVRFRESMARARRSGAPYALAFALVVLLSAVLGSLIWPENPRLASWERQVKASTALLAALTALGTGTLLAARLFLWDSVRGARLFEQTQANPMADIAAHFQWLLQHARKPVVFFIDDLDRCDHRYVVEFLGMIQTLVRTMDNTRRDGESCAAHFVVAAEGAWLRRSYETDYTPFTDTATEDGRPLGYLFLDKLFQLSLPMPTLSDSARSAFLDRLLRVANSPRPAGSSPAVTYASPWPPADGGVMERLRRFEEGRAQAVYEAMQSLPERRRAEHILRKFAPVLGDNPRAMKRFLNTYSVLRPIRLLEGIHVDPDALALWSLICVRWPSIADHLATCPEAVDAILKPRWVSARFPEELRMAANSPELREVVTSPDGGPLTPDLIRLCCGARRGRARDRRDRQTVSRDSSDVPSDGA